VEILMNKSITLFVMFAAFSASPAWSQAAPTPSPAQTKAAPAAPLTDGEVRKVDRAGGQLTLKHGEIKSLNMPAMTMAYPVSNAALLDKFKVGDKVLFKATNDGGKLIVTDIKLAK
jgi:Cu/Ag efflux protein CusF